MIPKILKILFITIFCSIIFILVFYTCKYFKNKDRLDSIPVIKDTTILYRYTEGLKHDTIIKWYEKIKYADKKPEQINVQTIDSLSRSGIARNDLIFKLDKENNELTIKTLDLNNNIIKEYSYEGVSRDFSIIAQKDNLYVKSKNIYFSGFGIYVKYILNREEEKRMSLGIGTGINWREKIFLSGKVCYTPDRNIFDLECELGIKIF